jgi:hypothetical protein
MKWTQTILIPKSITKVDWVNDELIKIINGYDPGGYSQIYINFNWDDKKDFDIQDAIQMIDNTHRDFNKNLEIMRDEKMTMYELVKTSHQMDLFDNFLSNWLIGYSSYNPYIGAEFMTIWDAHILNKYLDDHKEVGVWSVPLYIHI